MGEVYRARDERLDRDVAVKVVPEEVAADPDRMARFEREARALARIEHPNILTIHDFGEEAASAGGTRATRFAVTELLTGETLRARLARERLSWRRAVEIGAAVAEGVGAAHGQGIAHRDLKPDNIFLTSDNRVKILDFGLATSGVVHSGNTRTETSAGGPTAPGQILGTVGYMAPEQVQGGAVDVRADMFSLGCVLFEMVTGRRAFAGATVTETLAAILSAPTPVLAASGSDVPPDLEKVVARCLEKQPGARFQSAADLAFALRALLTSPVAMVSGGEASSALALATTRRSPRIVLWLPAAAVLVLGAALGYYALSRRSAPALPPRLANPVRLTTADGAEIAPTWSPDGRIVAYSSDKAGNSDIWVTQVGNHEAVNRTADSTADDSFPTWSPDGQRIAFRSLRDGAGYYVMPAVGGSARKVASVPPSMPDPGGPAWSPDSAELAYALGQRTDPRIEIVTLATGASRKLAVPQSPRNNVIWDLAWSPDGRWLAYCRGLSRTASTFELWVTRAADGASVQLSDGKTLDVSPGWSPDSRSIYFVSQRAGTGDLWRQSIVHDGRPDGQPQQLTAGLGMSGAAVSADGRRLAYSNRGVTAKIFRIPLAVDKPAAWSDATLVLAEEAGIVFIDVARDGRLVLSSDRTGNSDLFVLPASGGALQQITSDPALDTGPRWSPTDGAEIVYYSQRSGKREIWVTPPGTGPARQVTRNDTDNYYPAWSPNGQEIAFTKYAAGIHVIPAAGGQERPVTNGARDLFPNWSPNGQWIGFSAERGGAYERLWRVPAGGGFVEPMTDGPAGYFRWSPDGKRVVFKGTGERRDVISVRTLDTGQERPLTALSGRRGHLGSWGLATDGRFVYFVWIEDRGDIWIADLVAPSAR